MGKFVLTTDSSIGGYHHKDGKLVLFRKINDLNVVEVIEDIEKVKELIEKAAPLFGQIWQIIEDMFNSIIEPFPPVIKQDVDGEDIYYRYTEQKAKGKALDYVFYMSEDGHQIFKHEDARMPRAKKGLRYELKDYGYIK